MKIEPVSPEVTEPSDSGADSLLRDLARAPPHDGPDPIGQTLGGRYRIVALLGRGGMGRVYEADDLELGRRVAVKLVRPKVAHAEGVERFLRERTVTAELEHPSIVPVYDSGVSAAGQPFYVMRVARGQPLARLIANAKTIEARLALLTNVIAVADAVAFAHSHGIVHRDLKPSNVLVGAFGETLVADWGLAKRLHSAADDEPAATSSGVANARSNSETRAGAVVGTPAYMAPEQAQGRPIDERADVYALGAMLFELVAGHAPDPSELAGAGPPRSPAEKGDALADVMAIVNKAIARAPEDRYQTARELSDELRRLQTGQLVGARIYTRAQLLRRWAKRRRAPLVTAAALLIVLAAVLTASVVRIVHERNAALAQRAAAEASRQIATERSDELVMLQARAELTRDPTASLAWLKRYPIDGSEWATGAAIAADARSRGAARHVWDLGRALGSVAFSPDGREIAVGAADGTLTFIEIESGARRAYHAEDGVGDIVAFSPDGETVATSTVGALRLWNRRTGASRRLGHDCEGGSNARFSPDGALIQARHKGIGMGVWRVDTGEPAPLPVGPGRLVALVPGQAAIATAIAGELLLVDAATGKKIASTRLDGQPYDLRASSDGTWIAAARFDALALWNPVTGATKRISIGKDAVRLLVPSLDGRSFVSCGSPDAPDLWLFDVPRGTARQLSSEERCSRQGLALSPDGALLVSTGFSTELRVHDVAAGRMRRFLGHDTGVNDAAFSPDGRRIASVGSDGTARVWQLGDGDVRVVRDPGVLDRIGANGMLLAADVATGAISVVDARGGAPRVVGGPRPRPLRGRGSLSADGRVAAFPEDGALVALDVGSGARRVVTRDPAVVGATGGEALSADGATLAQADDRGALRLVDMISGSARELARLGDAGFSVAWSGDGALVAAGGRAGSARVWDAASGVERAKLAVPGWVWNVALSRDGRLLAAACTDGVVRVLDIASGSVRELRGHVGAAAAAGFSPDDRRLLTGGADGTLRLWDLASDRSAIVAREPGPIDLAAFSADGALVVHRSLGTTRIWSTGALPPLDPDGAKLLAWLAGTTSAEVGAKGHLLTP